MPPRMHRCPACGHGIVTPVVATTAASEPIEQVALRQLAIDLDGCHDDCWRFFEVLFASPRRTGIDRAKSLANELGVVPSTLIGRFYRAGLPSTKRYVQFAGFVHAARLLESQHLSLDAVAYEMGASSPQSFNRSFRLALELSAGEFRRAYTGETMLARFREELVLPYRERLLAFHPLLVVAISTGVRVCQAGAA